jgi:putative glutamine amidotransferase
VSARRAGGRVLVATSAEERAVPYVEALKAAGVPAASLQVVTPADRDGVRELAAGAAGLVLCGGLDVAPERYGEEALPDAGVEVSAERDELDWELLAAARAERVPVWGVCRGLQCLNVFLGGSLWQDLPTERPGGVEHSVSEPPDALVHAVRVVDAGMPLAERLAGTPGESAAPLVNSRHHQAVKRLADGLLPVALSPDGLVEAVVLAPGAGDGWWVRGVQWHPENLIALPRQRALWEDFARALRP